MMPTMFLGMVLVDPGLHSAPGQEFDQIRILNTFVTTNQDNGSNFERSVHLYHFTDCGWLAPESVLQGVFDRYISCTRRTEHLESDSRALMMPR